MSNIKILVCEDVKEDQKDIELYLDELDVSFPNLKIESTIKDFDTVIDELKHQYNLLILDFFDGNIQKGERILNHNRLEIPTIIYTSRAESEQVDYRSLKSKYKYLINYLPKLKTGNNLKDFIISFAFSNGFLSKNYSIYNENDIFLQNSIISIGQHQFNEILYQISSAGAIQGDVVIHRMTSGLSGAILFKIEANGKYSILKLSKEIDKLKVEHRNAVELYHKFPNRLINHIDADEFYSFDKTVLGILLKEVDHAQTLFEFILSSSTNKTKIDDFFHNLFIDEQGLKTHYLNNQQDNSDWASIFNKITEQKIHLIKTSFKEVKPIIQKYYSLFDIEDFRRLAINHNFCNLNINDMLDATYKKMHVLSHGDFHSKNVLIQSGNYPVLIDTGSISFQHWSLDICRLIVHLFITGIDNGKIEYFDINNTQKYIDIFDNILVKENIEVDGDNDNIIHAINWLVNNIDNVFASDFEIFEYQLGLMKEFLQVSYRFDTIPPNKRALALIAAHKCMIAANDNL